MIVLEARNIHKNYSEAGGKIEVLQGVNLRIEPGEKMAISGESGCGKSTLLHILGLLDLPDSGEILYDSKHIDYKSKQIPEIRNKTVGFVFQFHYLLEDFTVAENIAIPYYISSGNWVNSLGKARELLRRVKLTDRENHFPNQLSGGEQQRTAIARALINNPKIILADEPTGNLDPKNGDEIIDLMLEMNALQDAALVVVTHNREIASRMEKRYILAGGILSDQIT